MEWTQETSWLLKEGIHAPKPFGLGPGATTHGYLIKGISSLCTTTIALDGFNWDEVDTKLQILGFGGRDAGDATAVSYINYDTTTNDATYRFATLYDGFSDGLCSLEEMCDDKCQAGISGIIGRYIP